MTRRPVIGVAWPKADYLAALERANADARELHPETDTLPAALDACDGVLLTGGEDVDPSEYGEREKHPTVYLAPERDRYELALARLALARDLPMLAICRGAQVLNVAAGGTLIQDIPSQRPTAIAHSVPTPKNAPTHDVTVSPQTCLSVLLAGRLPPDRHLGVNSRHHQSVKDPAPGFVVSAQAPDGVVEAIEKPDAAFCVGVQWHPENFWQTGEFAPLFDGLVRAAADRAFRSRPRVPSPVFVPLSSYREYPPDEMVRRAHEFRVDLQRRRTVRRFSPRPVAREIIDECLLAAGTAPSGANLQPWRFVVIADEPTKQRIQTAAEDEERAFYSGRAPQEWLDALAPLGTDAHKPFLVTAPYLIAIFAETYGHLPDGRKVKHYYVNESVGIATGFLIAALHHAGLVSLTHTPSPMGFLNEILGRPSNERPYLLLVVGHPADDATVPVITKKGLADITG